MSRCQQLCCHRFVALLCNDRARKQERNATICKEDMHCMSHISLGPEHVTVLMSHERSAITTAMCEWIGERGTATPKAALHAIKWWRLQWLLIVMIW